MEARLVVADLDRTEKTVCLAVSPAMKALGVKNRCRVFEIPKTIDYITAPPRMKKYIEYAAEIYGIYMRYISAEDIYVYSIDEAFLDITPYLSYYHKTPKEIAVMLMDKVTEKVGLRATAGIGTNLYLTKIALDITAKHAPDFIGILDEESYCCTLWDHRPLTDFWRIGRGTAKRLAQYGITTMRQIAHTDEDFLYKLFGVDAELLIDHAWGREPVTIADIKAHKPKLNCLSTAQVLPRPYNFTEGRLILEEMLDAACLEMVEKGIVASSVSFRIACTDEDDQVGTGTPDCETNSARMIIPRVMEAYDRIVPKSVMIRYIAINCNNIVPQDQVSQGSLFNLPGTNEESEKDHRLQEAILSIKKKYGKNSVLKAMDLQEAATARERNLMIGGHKSGE